MVKLRFVIVVLVVEIFLITACQQQDDVSMQEFDKSFVVKQLKGRQLFTERLMLGQPFLMHCVDSNLVIYDNIADSLFTMIDLRHEDGRIWSFGRKGQGGNEFLQVFSLARMPSDSLLGIYDCFKHELVQVNLHDIKRGIEEYSLVKKDSLLSTKVYATRFNSFVGMGFYDNNMLTLTDPHGAVAYWGEYPYRDQQERSISNRLRGMAYQGTLCMNPSLDKLVYAVRSAPIFSIYSVDSVKIEETYHFAGGYPEYRPEENENEFSAPVSAHCKQAFLAAYATDSYIYLLYSGKSFADSKLEAFQGNSIYRIKWDGKPDFKFELDYPIKNFCVDDQDKIIYAIAEKGETELLRFSIDDNTTGAIKSH